MDISTLNPLFMGMAFPQTFVWRNYISIYLYYFRREDGLTEAEIGPFTSLMNFIQDNFRLELIIEIIS